CKLLQFILKFQSFVLTIHRFFTEVRHNAFPGYTLYSVTSTLWSVLSVSVVHQGYSYSRRQYGQGDMGASAR
uniref:CASP-like protein n=1 Tax=Haemonchus contortus TaxID=6289 RepID=A0A7I5ECB4_HAECO